MSKSGPIDFYELLPAVYRIQDAQQGYPLRAWLDILSEQANLIHEDIGALWDDFFIETCARWVIPYIGDLVGNIPVHEVVRGRRADVAKTIYYRLRKGTLPMLEEMARDVTGWYAHAVAFFDILGWTQNMNHLRPGVGTVDLRNMDALDRIDGPFDQFSHTVDVRPIGRAEGWYNIRNIGFFLWRLRNYELADAQPRQSAAHSFGYHFSALGNDNPLFNKPVREADEAGLAREIHVPGPIRPRACHAAPGDYYGDDASLAVVRDGTALAAADIEWMSLKSWDRPPAGKIAAVDVCRGRLTFAAGEEPAGEVQVTYNYGFSADLGGGSYDRWSGRAGEIVREPVTLDIVIEVPAPGIDTLNDALAEWAAQVAAWAGATPPRAVIQVNDNRIYTEDLAIDQPGAELVIQAANRRRPVVVGTISIPATSGPTYLTLNGLAVEGHIEVGADSTLEELEIVHCTLVPGRRLDEAGDPLQPGAPSLVVGQPNDLLHVVVEWSISGPLRVPEGIAGLAVRDAIVDSPLESAPARLMPVLISGSYPSPLVVTSPAPTLLLTIGDEGPHPITLAGVPATVAQARDLLQDAIQGAAPPHGGASPAFQQARVVQVAQRLVIIPGLTQRVQVAAAPGDDTWQELRFHEPLVRSTYALISGTLDPFPGVDAGASLTASMEKQDATVAVEGPFSLDLGAAIPTLAVARSRLQARLRAASAADTFHQALVGTFDDRLIVLPGDDDYVPVFGPTPGDLATLHTLALAVEVPAIAHSVSGSEPGPATTLERVTVLGPVVVREMALASEVILTDPLHCLRRQVGCVRFSYVPAASQTPRRYYCQPDLALKALEADEDYAALSPADKAVEREITRARLRPAFTARQYGHPAYAQLSLGCAEELKTGAENGAEMGAFSHLLQPQRETNLRVRLDEYLPFGLEPGIIYVT